MPSPLTQHSYVAKFVDELKSENFGIHKMFNKFIYSEQSTISMGQHARHYLLPRSVPLNSNKRQQMIAGEARFDFMTVPQFALENRLRHKC